MINKDRKIKRINRTKGGVPNNGILVSELGIR